MCSEELGSLQIWCVSLIITKPLTSENTASLSKGLILRHSKCCRPAETGRTCAHNSRVSSTAFKTSGEHKYPKAGTLTASQLIPPCSSSLIKVEQRCGRINVLLSVNHETSLSRSFFQLQVY